MIDAKRSRDEIIGTNYGADQCHEETMKDAVEALEKQISLKPIMYGDAEGGKLECPNCKVDLWNLQECGFDNCPYCGQRIDWSNEE